jgi:ABC-2 type transport system permease protein
MIPQNKWHDLLRPYITSFTIGWRSSLTARTDTTSMVVVYACLLIIMYTIFRIMPLHELGRPDISLQNMIWYFAIAEIVIVSMQGVHRHFGYMIADGELSIMIRRPCHMMFLLLARQMGSCIANHFILWAVALCGLWLIGHTPPPLHLAHIIPLFIAIFLGMLLYLTIGYIVCMSEIFGAYSTPFSFIVGKLTFTFGGLFFPVIFFPELVQKIAFLTPFPAIIFVPGQFMLYPTSSAIIFGLLTQIIWLAIMMILAFYAERRLVRYVMQHGD